jgi:hypothetical protein
MRLWKKVVIHRDYVIAEDYDRYLVLKYNTVEVVRKESEFEGVHYVVKALYGNMEYSLSAQAVDYKLDSYNVLSSMFIRANIELKPSELERLSKRIIRDRWAVLAIGNGWVFHGELNTTSSIIFTECIRSEEDLERVVELTNYGSALIDISDELNIETYEGLNDVPCYRIIGVRTTYAGEIGIVIDPAKPDYVDADIIKLVLRRGQINILRPM